MTEDQLLAELKELASRDEPPARTRLTAVIDEARRLAGAYEGANLHWRSVSLLAQVRDAVEPHSDLDRELALALGRKAELLLRWADSLDVRPTPPLLSSLDADLAQATDVDPTLPDVHWDKAVIAARYVGDWDEAREHLLWAKKLGYRHPMLPRLEAMIDARPPMRPEPDTAEIGLRRLVLELAEQARGPQESLLRIEAEEEENDARTIPSDSRGIHTFGEYVREARRLARADDFPVDAQLRVLGASESITGDSRDYVLDLLSRFAEMRTERDAPDARMLDRATNLFVDLLCQMSYAHFQRALQSNDGGEMRRALKATRRALGMLETSTATVDPDLHADLLLSRGQTLYALDQNNVIETIRCYREALRLKRVAENAADERRLVELFWEQIDSRVGEAMAALHMGGFGEAIDVLEACADAADDLDDPDRALAVRGLLGSTQRSVALRDDAEQNLKRVITTCGNPETVREARAELASVFSETRRPAEAAALQEELIADAPDGVDSKTAVLLSNYSQSLLLLDRLDDAHDALEQAWSRLPADDKQRSDGNVPELAARIRILQAELEDKLGNTGAALAQLDEAEALQGDLAVGIGGLHYCRTRARVLLGAGRADEALDSLAKADHLLRFMLAPRPSYPTWESMLHEWSSLDVAAVRTLIATGTSASVEKALLWAEAAKGRVTAWLEHAAAPKGAEHALDPDRQKKALEKTRAWLAGGPGRRVLSLFASDEGLAVFDLAPGADVRATWIADFRYEDVLVQQYDPWERLVEEATATYEEDARERADAATIDLLDLIGEWLEQGAPALADGGGRLVVIPHRLFRSLPLLHARLGGGARLSELFQEVVVAPTLDHLARSLDPATVGAAPLQRVAVADCHPDDPDARLPFARCEALLTAGSDRSRLGPAATTDALLDALQHPGIVLLSIHGDFNEEQPFRSKLFTADGVIELGDLVMRGGGGSLDVVLGACESGRSRRSVSDEPLSFPTLLLQGGARTVVAPSFPVDDFSSFLFTTRVAELLDEGDPLAKAVPVAARWLRELRPSDALERLEVLVEQLQSTGPEGRAASSGIRDLLAEHRLWIAALSDEDHPFGSTLDWAPFGVFVGGGRTG